MTRRKNFTVEPTTPYYIGDTWTDGTNFKKCKIQRLTGAYDSADWEAATDHDKTSTVIAGGLVTTGTLQVVQGGEVAAGITGNTSGDEAVRFWAGSTFEDRNTADFRVLQNGKTYMSNAEVEGTFTAVSGDNFTIVGKCGVKI